MAERSPKPVWDEVSLPSFPSLNRDLTTDVVVVGAGLAGITAAHLLKQAGCRVALFDRRSVGGVDTGCTTAHLTVVLDSDLTTLVKSFGEDHARAAWDAGFAAIDQIERNVVDLGLDCDFSWVPGFRHVAFDCSEDRVDEARKPLDAEAALARDLGFDVSAVDRTPLFDRPGWRIENQALFHPRKYLRGLLDALPGGGCTVWENSEVTFDDDGRCRVGNYRVSAPWVVTATHNPIVGRASQAAAALQQTRLALFTSYACSGMRRGDDDLLGCYWDTSSPYRYIRVDRTARGLQVIAGGEDHKTGQADDTRDAYAALERWASSLLPDGRSESSLDHRWSGQVIATNDGLPVIGEIAERQFVGSGFAGNGMTFGTLTAIMARDAIVGKANPWSALFAPGRSALARKPWDYLRQNADYPYYLVRDRFAGAQSRSLRTVQRGAGRIVEIDGQTVAAFRDTRGTLTTLSATCTHLGCLVGWNTAEQTWDCPCHGSRFNTEGQVLAGPAEAPLQRVTLAATQAQTKKRAASS